MEDDYIRKKLFSFELAKVVINDSITREAVTREQMRTFLFLDKDDRPMVAMHWEKYFQHAVEKHNKIYKKELPKITPHICRHTYCTNKAKSGMNPKTLQYLMGHSDISVTMNTYTHLGLQDTWEELQRLQLEYSQRELGIKKVHRL